MTKDFLNKLQKGIKNAGMETIAGLWKNMSTSESTDIRILCERKDLALSLNNIAEILSNNSGLLEAVYEHSAEPEQRDLETLALMA